MDEDTLKMLTIAGWIIALLFFMPAIILSLYTGAKLWKETGSSVWFMVSLFIVSIVLIAITIYALVVL